MLTPVIVAKSLQEVAFNQEHDIQSHTQDFINLAIAYVNERQWLSTTPTVAGWYWWQPSYSAPEIVHLFRVTDNSPLAMDRGGRTYKVPDNGRFAGPIFPPQADY